ncbi:C40 family peptidase [Salinactinospora qingdaonensis]|uniref:C40 family peptidase n=1 Tax=Salinactinospora qingdaonensis TaxID=702744 RepID=A0ABP7FCW5_9ACTN
MSFIAAGALTLSQGAAHADPSPDEVRDRIEQLEEEFSELSATYNQAEQDHDAAQEKLKELQTDLEEAENDLSELRESVRMLANAAYSGTDYTSPSYLLSSTGPEDALQQAADLGYLSANQERSLEEYADKKDKLAKLKEEAEQTEAKAKEKLEEAKEAKEEGEAKIEEQQELLDELTAEQQAQATAGVSSDSSSAAGAAYTGPASGNARVALDFAYAQLGKPYIWGGTGPNGYDCSGLTQAAWAQAGVSLPRISQDQFYAGQRVTWGNKQPGDLLFFYNSSAPTHVGIYAGNNKMVHASNSSTPISEVTLGSYYQSNFVGAVRP